MKPGPKKGVSRWHWYAIKRERDGKYYTGKSRSAYRFGKLEDAPTWRIKEAFSLLCRIRRHYRKRERHLRVYAWRPETFALEVLGDPKAKVRYPWPMPM